MLSLLYRMLGAVLLGAALFVSMTAFFPIFIIVMICGGLGAVALEMMGFDMKSHSRISGPLLLEKLGKFIVMLALIPLWLPFLLLKYVYYGIRAILRRRAENRRRVQQGEALALAERRTRIDSEGRALRDDLLFSCELFHSAHADRLAGHFSKADLDRFVKRYMGETESPDVLRRRSQELIALIRRQADSVDPPERRASLEQLTQWYTEQKASIDNLPLDEAFRQDFVVQLNERYAELCQKVLMQAAL